jgi:hypothetical protein
VAPTRSPRTDPSALAGGLGRTPTGPAPPRPPWWRAWLIPIGLARHRSVCESHTQNLVG